MVDRDTLILRSIREKISYQGISSLSDEELISLCIRKGDKIKDVFTISQNLLRRYKTLGFIYEMPVNTLIKENKGLSEHKIMYLKASFELGKRASISQIEGIRISCAEDIFKNLRAEMGSFPQEHFRVALLNVKNIVMSIEDISIGTINASLVHAREVFRTAIIRNSYSVILIHNHPSNDPTPSENDRIITQYLIEAGNIIGIKVLDHVIICKDSYYSFTDNSCI